VTIDTATFAEFARLLQRAVAGVEPGRTIRLAFDGNSSWLKRCQSVVDDLPFSRKDGPIDFLVSDSGAPGAWYFALNGQRLSRDLREFFWHANQGPHAIDLSLHSVECVEGRLRIPPVAGFYWREQHAAAMEAAPALLIIAMLRRLGGAVRSAESPVKTRASAVAPGAIIRNWFKFKKAFRSLYLSLPGTSAVRRWNIALHASATDTIPRSGWKWTTGFVGHEAADPFLVRDGDRTWLFYEDMLPASRHGRLAVMAAFDNTAEPSVILEKPYHLSYPCVFEHHGEWWMIPESSENATVDLYRARRFPHEWEHLKTLMQGPSLFDTTPLLHEGRWYFFTTAALPGRAYVSLLFVADALDAPWRLHPASPLNCDAAMARGAGPILLRNGRLIRPVQDCLVRYGYAITLLEILRLSPTMLEERRVQNILPSWHPGIYGTHTFCPAEEALALDALR